MNNNTFAVLVFVCGTILGAIVKSIFEMSIRTALEKRAHRQAKQKRKAKKARRRLLDRTRAALKINKPT